MTEFSDFSNIIKNVLLNNTGSTTILLESICGGEISVSLDSQKTMMNLENNEKNMAEIIRRETTLSINKIPVSKNIVFYKPTDFSESINKNLVNGVVPIGKLIMEDDNHRIINYKGMSTDNINHECGRINSKRNEYAKEYYINKGASKLFHIYEFFDMDNILKLSYQNVELV